MMTKFNNEDFSMGEEHEKKFDYCKNVDLHAIHEKKDRMNDISAVATEHGFRGIVVQPSELPELIKALSRDELGDKEKRVLPIALIDYPFGNSPIDIRNYSILSAKEKGAKEIEIIAPTSIIQEENYTMLHQDMRSVLDQCKKHKIKMKYVLNIDSGIITDDIKTRISRLLNSVNIQVVSTSVGYFNQKVNHSDIIMSTRDIKNKGNCKIKAYIPYSAEVEILANYVKAGTDFAGIDWKRAPSLCHAYENMVQEN